MSENMDKNMNVELNDETMEQAAGGANGETHRFFFGQICWYSDKQKKVKIVELTQDPYSKKATYTVEFLDEPGRIEKYVQDGHLGLLP